MAAARDLGGIEAKGLESFPNEVQARLQALTYATREMSPDAAQVLFAKVEKMTAAFLAEANAIAQGAEEFSRGVESLFNPDKSFKDPVTACAHFSTFIKSNQESKDLNLAYYYLIIALDEAKTNFSEEKNEYDEQILETFKEFHNLCKVKKIWHTDPKLDIKKRIQILACMFKYFQYDLRHETLDILISLYKNEASYVDRNIEILDYIVTQFKMTLDKCADPKLKVILKSLIKSCEIYNGKQLYLKHAMASSTDVFCKDIYSFLDENKDETFEKLNILETTELTDPLKIKIAAFKSIKEIHFHESVLDKLGEWGAFVYTLLRAHRITKLQFDSLLLNSSNGCRFLAEALAVSTSIQELTWSTKAGAHLNKFLICHALAISLKSNSSLKVLDLSGWIFDTKILKLFAEALRENSSLVELKFDRANVILNIKDDLTFLQEIDRSLLRNKDKKHPLHSTVLKHLMVDTIANIACEYLPQDNYQMCTLSHEGKFTIADVTQKQLENQKVDFFLNESVIGASKLSFETIPPIYSLEISGRSCYSHSKQSISFSETLLRRDYNNSFENLLRTTNPKRVSINHLRRLDLVDVLYLMKFLTSLPALEEVYIHAENPPSYCDNGPGYAYHNKSRDIDNLEQIGKLVNNSRLKWFELCTSNFISINEPHLQTKLNINFSKNTTLVGFKVELQCVSFNPTAYFCSGDEAVLVRNRQLNLLTTLGTEEYVQQKHTSSENKDAPADNFSLALAPDSTAFAHQSSVVSFFKKLKPVSEKKLVQLPAENLTEPLLDKMFYDVRGEYLKHKSKKHPSDEKSDGHKHMIEFFTQYQKSDFVKKRELINYFLKHKKIPDWKKPSSGVKQFSLWTLLCEGTRELTEFVNKAPAPSSAQAAR